MSPIDWFRRYALLEDYLRSKKLLSGPELEGLAGSELSVSERFDALKSLALSRNLVTHHALSLEETQPFVHGRNFYGETFEDALDTLG